ncbi:TatD family hydrolase [Patescibacteria group bacterium]
MLVDTHCHLPHKKYEKPIEEIIGEVGKLIAVGTSLEESRKAIEIAQKFENVYATVGIYPHDDKGKNLTELYEGLRGLISSKVVAIGECGMDITDWKNGRDVEEQKELFKMQVGLAVELDLPIVVHNRNGGEIILEILHKYFDNGVKVKGVMHSFSQDWGFAKKVLDLDFYISFSGMLTYPSNDQLGEVAKKVPEDRLLVETDAPYLPPQGHRGEINYPKYVRIIAEKLAETRNVSFGELEEVLYKNVARIFRKTRQKNN